MSLTQTQQNWLTAFLFGLIFGVLNYIIYQYVQAEMDFWWSVRIARDFFAGQDPYAFDATTENVPYPFPVFLIGIPFLPFSLRTAGALFVGFSVFLVVLGMLQQDQGWRLPMLLSFPFLGATLILPQWAPLVMAAWFFPVIAPYLVLVKPQNALPVALAKWHWIGIFLSAVILALTLILDPTWPWRWLEKTGDFEYMLPFLVLPLGPILLLAIRYWRAPSGRLLLLMALLPLRAAYDLPLLWLVTEKRWQVWTLTILSWVIPIFSTSAAFGASPRWAIPLLFVPTLLILVWNEDQKLIQRWLGGTLS
ncbi:MAG: hypothetical protein AAGD96_32255 [Chloroflexota bacterium]